MFTRFVNFTDMLHHQMMSYASSKDCLSSTSLLRTMISQCYSASLLETVLKNALLGIFTSLAVLLNASPKCHSLVPGNVGSGKMFNNNLIRLLGELAGMDNICGVVRIRSSLQVHLDNSKCKYSKCVMMRAAFC